MSHYDRVRAREAYDMLYSGRHHRHHEVSHELLAAAVGFEAMRLYEHHLKREGLRPRDELAKELLTAFVAAEIDKHFERGHYGHLNRHEARRLAHAQAEYLWRQQYGGWLSRTPRNAVAAGDGSAITATGGRRRPGAAVSRGGDQWHVRRSRMAPGALVRPARAVAGVAARCRRRAEAFAARYGVPAVHGAYADLLADPSLDAVYIPLPTRALRNGG